MNVVCGYAKDLYDHDDDVDVPAHVKVCYAAHVALAGNGGVPVHTRHVERVDDV